MNSDETLFYPFTVRINECGGSCYTTNNPYTGVCVLNKVKSMNVKVFKLISGVNKIRFIVQYESCEWKCRLPMWV